MEETVVDNNTNVDNNNLKANSNINVDKEEENIVINHRRKKDLTVNTTKNQIGINAFGKEEGKNKPVFQENINESDFENCNVHLKPKNLQNNRPNSRKRSAFKYIEDNLEKDKNCESRNKQSNLNAINNNSINPNETNQIFKKDSKKVEKPKIISESNKNKFLQNVNNLNGNNVEKKIEYESRRKKPMNFINGINNFSGGSEKQNTGSSNNLIKQEMNGTSCYESRRQTNLQKSLSSKDKDRDEGINTNKNLSNI